ncbi:MAG: metallophosphoesterase family protein [Candidatus Omnitrophica bacterium]|nr:metallophosphoesterase family protein [Candidatus Omnitrophota bacterium]
MRLLAISDTHSQDIPKLLQEEIQKADMIVHVGDFCDIDLLTRLKKSKEVKAVYGNMDGLELRQALPRQAIFKCEDVTIGLVHGEGAPEKLQERVAHMFKDQKVDAIIFGHSHTAMNKVINGVLFFNPGSPTDVIRAPYLSYGILEVQGKIIKGQIVKIK